MKYFDVLPPLRSDIPERVMQIVIRNYERQRMYKYLRNGLVIICEEFPEIRSEYDDSQYQCKIRLFIRSGNTDYTCQYLKDMESVEDQYRYEYASRRIVLQNLGKSPSPTSIYVNISIAAPIMISSMPAIRRCLLPLSMIYFPSLIILIYYTIFILKGKKNFSTRDTFSIRSFRIRTVSHRLPFLRYLPCLSHPIRIPSSDHRAPRLS